jgi:hypothetical protein
MPTPFEQQVIANTNKLNQILSEAQTFSDFDDVPGGIQPTDIVAIRRAGTNSTYKILFSDLIAAGFGLISAVRKQTFEATADQTNFAIDDSPVNLQIVFKGRNTALSSEYTYDSATGILSFENPVKLGTEITVIY